MNKRYNKNDEWLSKGNIQERLIELQGFFQAWKKKLFPSDFLKTIFMN